MSKRQAASVAPRSAKPAIWAFILGMMLYAAFFYAQPLVAEHQTSGLKMRRYEVFKFLLVPEVLAETWFAGPADFALVDRLPILATAAAILLVAWSVGMVVLRLTGIDREMFRLERLLFRIALGLSAMSLYTLAIGLAGGLKHPSLFLLPGAIATLVAIGLASKKQPLPEVSPLSNVVAEPAVSSAPRQLARPHVPCTQRIWRSIWFWLAIPFALFILLGGMLPPIDFDVREYHLQVPKEFFLAGRIRFLPHNAYGNMPLASEMRSLLGMELLGDWWRGALVGKTLEALFAPLSALALIAAGRRWFSVNVGTLAALVYLSFPWIMHVSTLGLVEGGLAFYCLMSIYALFWWREATTGGRPRTTQRLILSGFLAGSAVAIKYPAAVFVLLPLAGAVAWQCWRQRVLGGQQRVRMSRAARCLAAFSVAALAAFGPWLLKNWVLAGNPLYPLAYQAWGGETRTPENAAQWQRAHAPPNFRLADLAHHAADVLLTSQWMSPSIWPMAVLGAFAARDRRLAGLLCYFGYVFIAWWLFTHRIDRFWLPAVTPVCLIAGTGLLAATTRNQRIAIVTPVIIGIVYSGILLASGLLSYNRYFASLDDLRSDPERVGLGHRWLNEHVPHNETVLSVGDAQVFDLEMPVLYNTVFDPSVFEQRVRARGDKLLPTPEIRRRLEAVSYLYVDWREIGRYRSPGNYGFSEFVQPEVFSELVSRGLLEPPIDLADRQIQIFGVIHGNERDLDLK